MAQFTRLAAAIAAASLAGAVHAGTMQTGDTEVTLSGEVIFAGNYTDNDDNGSSSNLYLDTVWLEVEASNGPVTAGFALDYGDDQTGEVVDNAYINYKLNDNYTLFAKHDDTYIGFQKATSKWNDTLNDRLVDHDGDEMYGAKISGGPISSTIYITNGAEHTENGGTEDDLQNFGTSVDYEADMFSAHFGYISSVVGAPNTGAFSVGGTATLNNILLAAEYNWLSDEVNDEDVSFLHLGAEYTMNDYTLIASYETTEEADQVGEGVEDRIAFGVNKDINDMLYVQAELDFDSKYDDSDDVVLEVAVGAAF